MVLDPTFEAEGDVGTLTVQTHFGHVYQVTCEKDEDESFRLGGTAVSELSIYEGFLLKTPTLDSKTGNFKAFKTEQLTFEGEGVLSPEDWQDEGNRHCFISEYYPLDIEGKKPGWLVTKRPMSNTNAIYVNVDVLDGGGNLVKRYRCSMFFEEHLVLEKF
jgi:hypothetical protein